MSITVVVTRDYDNVPTCFEKYEQGTRWRVNSGNLEIFVGSTLAALYPSGNWVSVYVDDAMQLHKGSDKPDYGAMPTVDSPAADSPAADSPAADSPAAVITSLPDPEHDLAHDPDDVPWTQPPDLDPAFDDVPLATTASLFPDDDVVADRNAMMTVAFRPRRYRGSPPPATKAPTGPRLLPIKLRMRTFRQPAPDATTPPAADGPRMMPVTMRTTIYRAARPQPESRPDERPDERPDGLPDDDQSDE